jgi:hypothetical protein
MSEKEKIQAWIRETESAIREMPKITGDMRKHPNLMCELGIAMCALYEARHILSLIEEREAGDDRN